MGREVYHGDPKGDVDKVQAYNQGVREGAFGLLLNSVRTRNQGPLGLRRLVIFQLTTLNNGYIQDDIYNFHNYLFLWLQVVLGISSFLIEPMCQRMGSKMVWALSNFIVFACMAGTAIISFLSVRQYSQGIQRVIGANDDTKFASLIVFALLGLPLAVST